MPSAGLGAGGVVVEAFTAGQSGAKNEQPGRKGAGTDMEFKGEDGGLMMEDGWAGALREWREWAQIRVESEESPAVPSALKGGASLIGRHAQ